MAIVLVIDDDKDLLDFFSMLLTMNKFEVRSASKKVDILSALDSFTPDVILMDVMLSGINGRDLCCQIKESHKDLPIILVSASRDMLENYAECGASDTIEKPFEITEVIEKINKVI